MFLVAIDVEMLRMACCKVGDGLLGEVNLNLGFRVIPDTIEKFLQEVFANLDWEDEVVELVVTVDISKE